jgi:hypothetical protein
MGRGAEMKLLSFFEKAHKYIISEGFQWEIDLVENRYLKDITAQHLAWNFLFCALGSSGLNNKVVQKQYDRFVAEYNAGKDAFESIPNGRIREAVFFVWTNKDDILTALKIKKDDESRIEYIKTLPQMGPKTAYHFARNIGIDCIKPDIWMNRLAYGYGFYENPDKLYPERMCLEIQNHLPIVNGPPYYRIGTIDVILWRYCNLTGALK